MEELLVENYRYTFTLTGNRQFTARFSKIVENSPINTLHVSDYTDENGTVPGIRTMPFRWVKKIELMDNYQDKTWLLIIIAIICAIIVTPLLIKNLIVGIVAIAIGLVIIYTVSK